MYLNPEPAIVDRYGSDFDILNNNALICSFRLRKVGSGGSKSGGSSGASCSGLAPGTCGILTDIHGRGIHRGRSGNLDATARDVTGILSKAIIAVLAANITAHDGGEFSRTRSIEVGLAAALGG